MDSLLVCNFCGAFNRDTNQGHTTFYCGRCNVYQPKIKSNYQVMAMEQNRCHFSNQQQKFAAQVKAKDDELVKLRAEMKVKNDCINEQKLEIEALNQEIMKLHALHKEDETKKVILKDELIFSKKKIDSYQTTIQNKNNEIDGLTSKIEQLDDVICDLREMQNEQMLKMVCNVNETNKQTVNELQNQIKLKEVQLGCLVSQFKKIRDCLRPLSDDIVTSGSQINQMQSVVSCVENFASGIKFVLEKFAVDKIKPFKTYGLKTNSVTGLMKPIASFMCTIMGHFAQLKQRVDFLHKIVDEKMSYQQCVNKSENTIKMKCSDFDADVEQFHDTIDSLVAKFELVTSILDESSVQYNHLNCKLASAMYQKVVQMMFKILESDVGQLQMKSSKKDHDLVNGLVSSLKHFGTLSSQSFFHMFISVGANYQRLNEIVFSVLADDAIYDSDFVGRVNDFYLTCKSTLTEQLLFHRSEKKTDFFKIATSLTVFNEHVFLEKAARAQAGLNNSTSTLNLVINEMQQEAVQKINTFIETLGIELSQQIDEIKAVTNY